MDFPLPSPLGLFPLSFPWGDACWERPFPRPGWAGVATSEVFAAGLRPIRFASASMQDKRCSSLVVLTIFYKTSNHLSKEVSTA